MTYPARCPSCGAPAINALFSDPSVPIYGCGWYATSRASCGRALARRLDRQPNVVRVDSADMRELLDMVDLASVAVMRAAG
jgi:hypothetical protein